ncbi:MAG: ABC transporter ATP-binding protein [Candidatus Njordarchaeia archaeon]|nr:ABC transporter ATP-binding protein [Candidatus Korarchaeota archaeon]
MSGRPVLIELDKVTKKYEQARGSVFALRNISLKILQGEFIIILGPSGSGKTTMLNLISGMDRPTEGDIIFDRQSILGLSEEKLAEMRRKKIGFVFQFFNLIDNMTALENVMVPLLPEDLSEREMIRKAEDKLDLVDMFDKRDRFPNQLSGGEQQRVAIARALVNDPDVIIADEPTAQLDPDNTRKVLDILKKLNRMNGVTVIIATNDEELVRLSRDVITKEVRLKDGQIQGLRESSQGRSWSEVELG